MHWTCPGILAIACTTLMSEIDSCGKKGQECNLFEPFSGQVERGRKHAKSGGTCSCISSIYGFMMRPFAEHYFILLLENTNTTLHCKETKQQAKCKR